MATLAPCGVPVDLDANTQINHLCMTDGIDLLLNGYRFDVLQGSIIGGTCNSDTILWVEPRLAALPSFQTKGLELTDGGIVDLQDELNIFGNTIEIETGGLIRGAGEISLNYSGTGGATVLQNSGEIQVQESLSTAGAGTLVITNSTLGDGRVDLDGTSENGRLDIDGTGALTLKVESPLKSGDPFSGTLLIGDADTLDIVSNWTANSGILRLLGNGFTTPATIKGGDLDLRGTLTVWPSRHGRVDSDLQVGTALASGLVYVAPNGYLQLYGDTTVNQGLSPSEGGVIRVDDGGTVDFRVYSASTIKYADGLQLSGGTTSGGTFVDGSNATLTVSGDLTVLDPEQVGFNWDGDDAGHAATVINDTGSLTLDVRRIDGNGTDQFDGTLTLNGGALSVDNFFGSWTMDRTLNMANTNGVAPVISGDKLIVGNDAGTLDADVRVTGAGSAVITSDVEFRSDADVYITDGILNLNGDVLFAGGKYGGTGTAEFRFGPTNTVSRPLPYLATQIGTPNVTHQMKVDLDSGDWILESPLELHVEAIDVTAGSGFGANRQITVGTNAYLGVYLNGDDHWSIDSNGTLLIQDLDGGYSLVLDGSDLEVAGVVNVQGVFGATAGISARLDIPSGGELNLQTTGHQTRIGGGGVGNPNRLLGGTINGPGTIDLTGGDLIYGYGEINAPIDGTNQCEVRADGGLLLIVDDVLAVGTLGTASSSGILHLEKSLDTGNTDLVELLGGVLSASAGVTNASGHEITGFGTITATVNNRGVVSADGGELVLVDWTDCDGSSNSGTLEVVHGDLTIDDGALDTVTHHTDVPVANGHAFTIDALEFENEGTLALDDGNVAGTALLINHQTIEGHGVVSNDVQNYGHVEGTAADQMLAFTGAFCNKNTGSVGLHVDFTNKLEPGCSIGTLLLAGADRLTSTANLTLEIESATSADLVTLLGEVAVENSTLTIDFVNGYVPSPGQEFTLIHGADFIMGGFGTTVTVGLPPGLTAAPSVDGAALKVRVVALCDGDMNCDGAVTFADIDKFVQSLSGQAGWSNNPANAGCPWLNGDTNHNGAVTFADIDGFVARLGSTCP